MTPPSDSDRTVTTVIDLPSHLCLHMSTNRQGPLESTSRLALDESGEDGLQERSLMTPDNRKGRLSLRMLLNSESPERELESSRDNIVRSTTNFYGNISGGTGGRGGSGGEGGGSGGRGEGPLFIAHQQVFVSDMALSLRYGILTSKSTQYSSTDAANLLKDLGLKYISARYNAAEITAQKCMDGTRVKIIQDIIEQLTRPPDLSLRLVLCSGPAGSGKSTIAKTVATHLEEEEKILAASFFFSRDYVDRKELKYLPSTLAHQLADYNQEYRSCLVTLLKDDRKRLVYADPKEQFQKMIVELLAKMPVSRTPWVICLDALDECGKDHGKTLLHWLSDAMSDIPVYIRFFLTGRPEVRHSLTFNLSVLCKHNNIEAIDSEMARKDIHFYISHSLIDPTWDWKVTDRDADEITRRADGLFIFAATAVRYVHTRAEDDVPPQESVDIILNGNTQLYSLDDLYLQIIEEVIEITEAFERTKRILGAIVDLVEPQDIKTLAGLLQIDIKVLQRTLVRLSAVLSIPEHNTEGVIKIIHLSFLAFSPDNKWIVSGSWDNTVYVWDAESGQVVAGPFNGHTDRVTSVAFSPDSKWIVSGSNDHTVHVWDAESGEVVAGPFNGHTGWVNSVAFSPDGKQIVSGSKDNTVRVWDAESGEVVAGPFNHTDWVYSVAFLSDGKQIISVSRVNTMHVWDVESGEVVAGPFNHIRPVYSVAFSPDSKWIVSGSNDHTVRVWDAKSGQVVAGPFNGHTGSVYSVAFSPDSKWIVSGSNDHTVRVWDAKSGQVVAGPFNGHTSLVASVAFSPDGKRIVSGSWDNTVRVWDVESGGVVASSFGGHTSSVNSVAFSPDGKQIVPGSEDNTVHVWDFESGEVVAGPFNHTGCVYSVAFLSDGKQIISGSRANTMHVWDVESGEVVAGPFDGYPNQDNSVLCLADFKRIVPRSWDNIFHVWSAESREVVAGPFSGHTSSVCSAAFSPDGKQIVSGSEDNTVHVWDAESGEVIAGPFNGHTNCVYSVAFSPDGKQIVSGSKDNTVRVWDAESGQVVAGPFNGHTSWVNSVAFSPDSKQIVSGSHDNTVRVWDAESGQVVASHFNGHTSWVNSAAFPPDGRRIVSSSDDSTVHVWDAARGGAVIQSFSIVSQKNSIPVR
ncbi:WD-REPEATS-REGION domain-containing protein [Mycena sanguinolenta]|uniref:WD-REPEATS-REGION domain-containing protein n=1 Tax=Mycena sanguinolenta TaxID=230812 RepID=A0A8H6XT73_9AGAR|nr:WD-REPEATS-REGION domain-containing protein [Mycena sanguinolenta]